MNKTNGNSNKYFNVFTILILLTVSICETISMFYNVLKNKDTSSNIDSNMNYSKISTGASTQLEGAGTITSPYLIKSASDLIYMRNTINTGINNSGDGSITGTEENNLAISAYYKLVNDIDLTDSNITLTENERNWVPICPVKYQADNTSLPSTDNSFTGKFNGNHKTIKFKSNHGGLFGKISDSSIVKNLTVDVTITKDSITSDLDNDLVCLGGIVGYNLGKIVNCNTTGNITLNSSTNESYSYNSRIGGIVGINNGLIQHTNCKNLKIFCSDLTNGYVGGICGLNMSVGTINDCKYTCDDSSDTLANINVKNILYSGGLVGKNYGKISNIFCNIFFEITLIKTININCGGIVGYNSPQGTILNAVYKSKLKLLEQCTNGEFMIQLGGIAGCCQGKIYNSYSAGELIYTSNYTSLYAINIGQIAGLVSKNNTSQTLPELKNCYSVMNYTEIKNNTRLYLGCIPSIQPDEIKPNITHCYGRKNAYKDDIKDPGCGISFDTPNPDNVFKESLNTNRLGHENDWAEWTQDANTNNGYPTLLLPSTEVEPEYNLTDNALYANGKSIIINKEGEHTVIYWDKDNNHELNTTIDKKITIPDSTTIPNIFGGFKDDYGIDYDVESYITMLNGSVTNIYGGSHNCNLNGKSTIVIKGGNINNIYGGGLSYLDTDNSKTLLGTTIDIQGGIIDNVTANGANINTTEGKKVIKLSGSPTIGSSNFNTGIDLSSFTDNKIFIEGNMSGNNDSINILNADTTHNTIIASLTGDYELNTKIFTINVLTTPGTQKILYRDTEENTSKISLKVVDVFNATLSDSSSNIIPTSFNGLYGIGFGDSSVIKDKIWEGHISAANGYMLPDNITVTIGDQPAEKNTAYTYNKDTGKIEVLTNKTIGNIIITAQAVAKPVVKPIIYIDKPSISNDNLIYTGKPQQPIIIPNDKYTVSISPATNVGKYTIKVSLKDKSNTKWADETTADLQYTWTINKAPLQIVANDKTITYGDSPVSNGVKYIGFLGNDTDSSLKGKLSYTYNYKRYDNVGKYTITPQGYTSDNYDITYKPGVLTVSPKRISFIWPNKDEFKYDGKDKQITATINGLVNNDDVHIRYYSHNTANKVGRYNTIIKGLSGSKSNNYTFAVDTNLHKEWSIVKPDDIPPKDDSNKDTSNEDTTNKNNTNKGNSNNNTSNNSSYPPNKINPFLGDSSGMVEGTRINKNEFIVKLDDGTIIRAEGNFTDSIRLMVKSISKKEKIWNWLKNVTDNIGENKGSFDIFFINNSGKRINTGKGTKISILSNERKQDIEVYYIASSGDKQRLESTKEEYTVQFNMVHNGYYTLLTCGQSIELEKNSDGNITKKKNNNNNTEESNDTNKNNIKNNNTNQKEDGNKTNSQSPDGTANQDSSNKTLNNSKTTVQKGKNTNTNKNVTQDNNRLVTFIIIFIIIFTTILFIIILKKQKKNEYNVE